MTKVALTYFDDVTTIENNGQVHVNIDATLVAIFRIIRVNLNYGNMLFLLLNNFLLYLTLKSVVHVQIKSFSTNCL